MARRPELVLSVSYTTRPPRPTEKHGFHYFFVSEREFLGMRDRAEFLEWAEVYGHLYGTARQLVEENLSRGRDVLLEIDVQGAREVKRKMPDSCLIFIEAPSFDALEQRLRKRRTEHEEEIERRKAAAYQELRQKRSFDGVVVNHLVDQTIEEVLQLIDQLKER